MPIGRVAASLGRDRRAASEAFTGLRIVEDGVRCVDRVFGFGPPLLRCLPMFLERCSGRHWVVRSGQDLHCLCPFTLAHLLSRRARDNPWCLAHTTGHGPGTGTRLLPTPTDPKVAAGSRA